MRARSRTIRSFEGLLVLKQADFSVQALDNAFGNAYLSVHFEPQTTVSTCAYDSVSSVNRSVWRERAKSRSTGVWKGTKSTLIDQNGRLHCVCLSSPPENGPPKKTAQQSFPSFSTYSITTGVLAGLLPSISPPNRPINNSVSFPPFSIALRRTPTFPLRTHEVLRLYIACANAHVGVGKPCINQLQFEKCGKHGSLFKQQFFLKIQLRYNATSYIFEQHIFCLHLNMYWATEGGCR